MRLLLVEDDAMIGEAVLDLLRAEHYAVDWVKDGEMPPTRPCAPSTTTWCCSTWACRGATAWRCCARCARASERMPVLVATARDAVGERIAGPGCRRRRLRAQTLRPRRAAGAHPRAAAARRRPGRAGVRAHGRERQSGHPRGPVRRPAGDRCRRANGRCSSRCWRGPAWCCRARSSRRSSTAGRTRSAATRSRSTSTGCARSWAAT